MVPVVASVLGASVLVAGAAVAGAAVTGARSTSAPSPGAGVPGAAVAPGPVAPAAGLAPVGPAASVEGGAGSRAAVGSARVGRTDIGGPRVGLAAAAPRGRWQWPLTPRPRVARPFAAPRSTWGAGHRGVDLASASGQPVRAVAAGTVTHVGVIAGRPTVTVAHPDGLRSTYEPVDATVRTGDTVTAGQVLGTVVVAGSHCSPSPCLHLGALRGREYLDPMTLLGPVRVRLLPLWRDGP